MQLALSPYALTIKRAGNPVPRWLELLAMAAAVWLTANQSGMMTDPVQDGQDGGCSAAPSRALIERRKQPSIDDLPIPENIVAQDEWPESLLEIADHIGAYDALHIAEVFGGADVYIPANPERSPFVGLISDASVHTMSHVFRRERLAIPVSRDALGQARRQGLVAAIREGGISVSKAARVAKMNRRYLSGIVNHTDEGKGYAAIVLPEPRGLAALRMAAAIVEVAMVTLGAPMEFTAGVKAEILDLWFNPKPAPAPDPAEKDADDGIC